MEVSQAQLSIGLMDILSETQSLGDQTLGESEHADNQADSEQLRWIGFIARLSSTKTMMRRFFDNCGHGMWMI